LRLVVETDNFQKCAFDRNTLNLIPEDDDSEDSVINIVKEIVESLMKFDEMCRWLQLDDPSNVKMSKVIFYFEKLISEFPEVRPYLGKDSDIVHCPDFDNGISKIQLAADQGKVSASEKAVVAIYAIDTNSEENLDSGLAETSSSFIEEANIEYESKRQKNQPPYKSTLHISPTSNIVERLFSICGIIMRPPPPYGSKYTRNACVATFQ
jgi:hypothetical protein